MNLSRPSHRYGWIGLVLALGILVFYVGGYLATPSMQVRTALKTLIAAALFVGWLVTRAVPRRCSLHSVLRVYWIGSAAFLCTWLVGLAFQAFESIDATSIQGVARYKLIDALPIVVCIVALNWATAGRLKDLYLQRGRLGLGLAVGLGCFAAWLGVFLLMAKDAGIATSHLLASSGSILLFIFANAFMEELHFRGLALRPLESLLGKHTANVAIAVYFTLVHAPVRYAPDLALFLVVLFLLSLTWGYLAQWTRALWSSILFHAGADLVVLVGLLSSA